MHDKSAPRASDQEAIWDHFQNDASESFAGARQRLHYLAGQLRRGQRALNIGVGDGTFEERALALGLEVSTLDPSARAIDALRNRLELGDRAQVGYAQAMPFGDETFDAVVASEVFEHLTSDVLRQSLQEVRRVLKPGGILLGTVPARESLAQQLIVCPCCGQKFHRWGHQQSFTCASLSSVLAESLQVERIAEKYFASWNTLNWKGYLVCGAKSLFSRLGSHGSEENIVFRARKPQR